MKCTDIAELCMYTDISFQFQLFDLPGWPGLACRKSLAAAGCHNIHTGIFQGKIKNFPGLETPPFSSSDPTVQYSVGPMVRSYTRYVPILRTFFISEFRGSRSSGLTCKKKVKNFPGPKLSRAKLSRGKLSRGKTFQGKTF